MDDNSDDVILHICRLEDWHAADAGGYRCASLDTEGFIHCSRTEQVVETANRIFLGQRDLALLLIDSARVLPEIKHELAENGQVYPHIYGALNTGAVVTVLPFAPGRDGRFSLPAQLKR